MILVNKPAGMTSMQVDSVIKRIAGTRKVGHSGTLDPFACGLLPVYVGDGLRFVRYTDGYDKAYRCIARFGQSTDTMDTEGQVNFENIPDEEILLEMAKDDYKELRNAFAIVCSRDTQIPPKYSAKKIDGKKAYEIARAGGEVELKAQKVKISEEVIHSIKVNEGFIDADFELRCSKGTYIRVICDDWGKESGLGAYATYLQRTKAGPFSLGEAIDLDVIKEMAEQGDYSFVVSPEKTISFMPEVIVDEKTARDIKVGKKIKAEPYKAMLTLPMGQFYKVTYEGELLAVMYEAEENGIKLLRIDRMLAR